MAEKVSYPNKGSLRKQIGIHKTYLTKSWSLTTGYGWFCQIYRDDFKVGNGFHKRNKFSAVRKALLELSMQSYRKPIVFD